MQSDASTSMLMWFCQLFELTVAVVQISLAEPNPVTSALLTTLNPRSNPALHTAVAKHNTIPEDH